MDVTRREFLKTTTTAAALLAGVPGGWAGGVYAADGPEAPKVRIGIIALTDCSSLVMAHELGLFKKYGIESTKNRHRQNHVSVLAANVEVAQDIVRDTPDKIRYPVQITVRHI